MSTVATSGADGLEGPFSFLDVAVDGRTVRLGYRIGADVDLTETVTFPVALPDTDAARAALRVLHLVAGVSYAKCIVPSELVGPRRTPAEGALVDALYDEGLRELAYRNGIPVPLPVDWHDRAGGQPAPATAPPSRPPHAGALLPIGGGKDSALVADLVPEGRLLTVNPTGAHERFAAARGRPLVAVERRLDPRLRDLVAAGATNGHVPVTAIVSAIAVVAAIALDAGDVVMGLERSASEPSLVVDGVPINHQYSKSVAAEHLLAAAFAPTGVRYFSLLRPLTELAIGTALTRRGIGDDIVSCNRVFTVWNETTASREQRPCGECAKCLFTALVLAPSSDPEAIRARFGRDVFDEPANVTAVADLWSAEKPFDCVGERLESAAALSLLADETRWREHVVVRELAESARKELAAAGVEPADALVVDGIDALPADYRDRVRALATGLADPPADEPAHEA